MQATMEPILKYRNLPFATLGILIIILYYMEAKRRKTVRSALCGWRLYSASLSIFRLFYGRTVFRCSVC